MKYPTTLNALNLKVGGFMVNPILPPDTLGNMPIGDFHEDPKPMKTLADVYAHTELDQLDVTDLAIRVEQFSRNNIGMSYRVMVSTLVMLKIAEANKLDQSVLTTIQRCVAWTGRILHEGGSLSGLTDKWEAFWINFNNACRPWQPMLYFKDKDLAQRFVWFSSDEALKDAFGEDFKGFTYKGLDAVLVLAKDLLDKENTLSANEWGVVHKARMTAVLMDKIEKQRDVNRSSLKPLPNSELPAPLGLDLKLGELAVIVGVLSRGSKGILAQSWNRDAVMDIENPGNFAKRLSDDLVNRVFPNPCLTKKMLFSIKNVHTRLQDLALKAKEEAEFESLGF